MTKLAKFFYRFLFWITPWWYGLTQTFTRKKRYPPVKFYGSVSAIPAGVEHGRYWRADPWKGILDVMMSPRKFQRNLDEGRPAGDCDDHALYWATALLKSNLADKAFIGTVWFSKPDGSEKSGHAVCVFVKNEKCYWADYNNPRRFTTNWEWSEQVARNRGKVCHAAGLIEVKLRKSGEPKLRKRVKTFIV